MSSRKLLKALEQARLSAVARGFMLMRRGRRPNQPPARLALR